MVDGVLVLLIVLLCIGREFVVGYGCWWMLWLFLRIFVCVYFWNLLWLVLIWCCGLIFVVGMRLLWLLVECCEFIEMCCCLWMGCVSWVLRFCFGCGCGVCVCDVRCVLWGLGGWIFCLGIDLLWRWMVWFIIWICLFLKWIVCVMFC